LSLISLEAALQMCWVPSDLIVFGEVNWSEAQKRTHCSHSPWHLFSCEECHLRLISSCKCNFIVMEYHVPSWVIRRSNTSVPGAYRFCDRIRQVFGYILESGKYREFPVIFGLSGMLLCS
jgi:hypothetical protein